MRGQFREFEAILLRILLDFSNRFYWILVLFKEKVAPTTVLDDRESRMAGNQLEAPTRVLDEGFWLSRGFRFKCGSFFNKFWALQK